MATLLRLDAYTHDHVYLGTAHFDYDPGDRWVLALTAVFMVGEIVGGYLTGSMALLADGFHIGTHAGVLAISAAAFTYAKRHARDATYSFGTWKLVELAAFAWATALGLIALAIGFWSVQRLFAPITVAYAGATKFAIVALGVNVVSGFLLSRTYVRDRAYDPGQAHDHPTAGPTDAHHVGSRYAPVLAAAITSFLAIVALLAGSYLGWVWMDPVIGMVSSVIIVRWSWKLARNTASVLLDTTNHRVSNDVRELLEGPGDIRIVDLHIWRVGPEAHAAIVSVLGGPGIDGSMIRARLATVHELTHLTVECR